MQNLIFKGLNGHLKIAAATQYITGIKDSTKKVGCTNKQEESARERALCQLTECF